MIENSYRKNMMELLKGKHEGKILDFSVCLQVIELGPTGGSNKERQIFGQLELTGRSTSKVKTV
jgi:hypothetical protein